MNEPDVQFKRNELKSLIRRQYIVCIVSECRIGKAQQQER